MDRLDLSQRLPALGALVIALHSASCGGLSPAVAPAAQTTETRAAQSDLRELNRRAREAGATEETHFEQVVHDPFRALESDSASTREWIEFQTERTTRQLAEWEDDGSRVRAIERVLAIGTLGGARVAGTSIVYLRRDEPREQPALYLRDGRGEPRILVDPTTYGPRAALDWYFLSPRGRYVAFGISQNGDERSTLRVIETATGNVLSEVIPRTKWTDVGWVFAEDGFYYRRYPGEGDPHFDVEHPDTYHPSLYFHRIGADPANDALVFEAQNATDFPSADVSADDRWVTINVARGWVASDVYLLDRGAAIRNRVTSPDTAYPLVPVDVGGEHLVTGRVHRGKLFLLTNENAPRFRIASVPATRATERTALRDVVGEGQSAIDSYTFVGDRLAVHVIENVRSRIRLYREDGRPDLDIELPSRGEVSSLAADEEAGRAVISFSSPTSAPAVYEWNARERRLVEVARIEAPVDLSALELTQESVLSRDGTSINVYLLHRRDWVRDGSNLVHLTGYGGFNISLLPGFTRHALYWVLERGGVYAVANLRGGAEFGEEWHRAGSLANKENVFDDMEAVTRWLSASGISQPSKIGLSGGSNGGLLIGAMLTRAPDAFGACAAYVGLYDMVRYQHFPPAELWATEYGRSENANEFEWLYAYSPYHRVREGVRYPPVLIETADHDTRVHWAHSTKFAARLQEASGEDDPQVWFYRERDIGHGAGTRTSDLVRRYHRLYTFFENRLARSP